MMSTPAAPSVSPAASLPAGGRAIFFGQMFRLTIRLGSAAALTRLLTPDIYGLYGMVLVIYGFLYMARDFGIGTAIQQPTFSRERFNAHCRVAAIGGVLLVLTGASLGPVAAWFYREPRIPSVLAVMSCAVFFSAMASPAQGLLYRELKTRTLVIIEVIAMALSSAAAVTTAWRGAGVWSLVLLALVNECVSCAGAWWCSPWKPHRQIGPNVWRQMLGFGAHLTGTSLAGYTARTIDQPAVGWGSGSVALGFYGRAAQITAMPLQFGIAPFTGWAIASLSRQRVTAEHYVATFRHLLNGLLHVSLAAAAIGYAIPELGVRLLYGESWMDAAPILRWLAPALAVQPWLFATNWLLESIGRTRRLLGYSLVGLVLVGCGCFLAARHGPIAVAMTLSSMTSVQVAMGLITCRAQTPVRARDWIEPAILPMGLHSGFALVLLAGKFTPIMGINSVEQAIVVMIAAGIYYGGLCLIFARVRMELKQHFLWPKRSTA